MSDTLMHQPQAVVRPMIIDADVHPWVNGDIAGLKKYLSRAWWEHFDGRRVLPNQWLRPPLARASSNRIDALPPGGGDAGSDPVFMKEEHLDKHNIAHAVLSSIQAGKLAALPNAGEALALATAFNEFFLNEFLAVDARYKLAMVVAAHDPTASAAEIRRLGPLPGVVAVFMPLLNIMMGNRHYDPIYAAAEEVGLPILIHPTGTEGGFPTSVAFAGGTPSTYIERHTNFPQIGISAINSLVFEGTFLRFPRMKVLAAEFGFSWLPHFLWRMDQNWHQFRKEVPWVTAPPQPDRARSCPLYQSADRGARETRISRPDSGDDPCRENIAVQHGLSALGQRFPEYDADPHRAGDAAANLLRQRSRVVRPLLIRQGQRAWHCITWRTSISSRRQSPGSYP